MDDKLSIKVNIADRYYPLRIDRKEEEQIRKAAKTINDRVMQYRSKYSNKDHQDFLAMAALQFVTKLIESEQKKDITPFIDNIRNLEEELDAYLKGE